MSQESPHGKICYIEIPANDVRRSSEFYEKVFGWRLRKRGDGAIAFDDTTGGVSGTWIAGRPPASAPGLLIYIWCCRVAASANGPSTFHAKTRTAQRAVPTIPNWFGGL